MESVLYNGSMLGATLDFTSTDQYIVGTTQTRPAPIFVGSQTYGRAGSTVDTAVTFALTGGVGTTPQAGDFVVLSIAIGQTNSTSAPQGITGYTTLGQVVGADTYDAGLYVGTKVMGSTPDTTFPVRSSYSIDNAQAAIVFVWRNVESLDVASTTASGANSRAANPPAITPVTENSIVMAIGSSAHVGGTVNYTNTELQGFRTAAANDTYDVSLGAGYVNWTTGAFDPVAFTITGSTTADSWAALTLALKPALVDTVLYGNKKNSGIWNLQSAYEALYARDPYFANISLLLHGNGVDAGTVFTDSSLNALTFTASGNARTLTGIKKYGTSSMFFDGTGDYITTPYSSAIDLLVNSFTIEGWIYPTAGKSVGMRIFSTGGGTVGWSATTGIHILLQLSGATNVLDFQLSSNTTTPRSAVSTTGVSLNTWTHIAATFNGTTGVSLFINGVQQSFTITAPLRPSTNPTGAVATIPGEAGGSTTAFQGYIDDLRVTKGVVRYTSNFTPPADQFPDN